MNSYVVYSDDDGNLFQTIPPPPNLGLELTASFKNINSEMHALQLSVKKWTLLYDQCSKGVLLDDGGIGTSALCQLYFFSYPEQCVDCPVSIAGYSPCKGSPYWDYHDALGVNNLPLAKEAAANEIDLLEGLFDDK